MSVLKTVVSKDINPCFGHIFLKKLEESFLSNLQFCFLIKYLYRLN